MKFWKHTLVTAFVFFGIATTVTYTACTEDACKTLRCRNGGTCADDFCRCPEGYEGTQCETVSAERFLGFYDGFTKIDDKPVIIDSAIVEWYNQPLEIQISVFSNKSWSYHGRVVGETVIMNNPAGTVTDFNYIGTDKIELLLDETVDGERRVVNFSGVKRSN